MKHLSSILISATIGLCPAALPVLAAAGGAIPVLPGEPTADQILNGAYPFPASPRGEVKEEWTGFAKERLSKMPAPGVHPRILLSPEDLPDLRRRIAETETGRTLIANLRERVQSSILKPGNWENEVYEKLAAGDTAGALAILNRNPKPNSSPGHYQPYILYALVMQSFDAMVKDDQAEGKKVAAAIAGYARMATPFVEQQFKNALADDVWRAKTNGPTTGNWSDGQGLRDLVGYHNLGYAYDFAFNFMTGEQRDAVRSLIARLTAGRIWMGAQLPHHFRNWNWIEVGLSQPLLALAIEGENGYDPRVYRLGAEIARDYLTYGISPSGASTEAVGYTQFGLVWGNPFVVAAARRGENLLVQSHHRNMVDWYLQSMEPFGFAWTSHGDGGDTGPALWTVGMWKHFFPKDEKIDFLWQNTVKAGGKDIRKERIHIIEPLIYAADGLTGPDGKPADYQNGARLGLPLTWFDPVRSSLIARSGWSPEATAMQFECRTDSVGSSHEHADRGAFTFSALGRCWAKDNFRSVETRHHNGILIDGLGQGFWPGPGQWLGLQEAGNTLVAACDIKEAYGWWWPKQILSENPKSFIRFAYPRWESYGKEAETFQKLYGKEKIVRDTRPSVVAHWQGFDKGNPRMWDEDSWPVRLRHNPVQRAFRSVIFGRGAHPWLLVVDDIQKDNQERLYEWLMQTGMNTEVVSIVNNDIILCDATVKRDDTGAVKPARGDRQLLVRILDMAVPAKPHDFQSKPSVRLETFDRKDTLVPETKNGVLSGARTFGLDKRLVIASRSVAPDYKILLYPHRNGEPLPTTTWNQDQTLLTITVANEKTVLKMTREPDGRTRVSKSEEN